MKVIFSEEFSSDLSKSDSILEITNCIFSKYWDVRKNLNEILKEDYLNNCINKTEKLLVQGIWSNYDNILRLCINIPKNIGETMIGINYEIIYFFYKNFNEEEKIAFILINPDIDKDGFIMLSRFNISVSRNIINIPIPNTKSNIKAVENSNNDFLEGFGTKIGDNIFRIPKENVLSKISINSYFRYLRNKCSNENKKNISLFSIDSKGEKIYNNNVIRTYTKLNLYTNFTEKTENGLVRKNLSNQGGVVKFQTSAEYIDYRFINNYQQEIISKGTTYNINSSILEEVNKNNKGIRLKNTILQDKKKLYYGINEKLSIEVFSDFQLYLKYYNKITDRFEELRSNVIRLSQLDGYSSWKINHNTTFYENGVEVYVLNNSIGSTCTFNMVTNQVLKNEDILISTEQPEEFNKYFDITSTLNVDPDINNTTINVSIIAKKDNSKSNLWNPLNKLGKSNLMLVTIKIIDKSISFYCIQQKKLTNLLKLYSKKDNSFSNIDNEIIFDNTELKRYIYPTSISELKDDSNEYFWKILSKDDNISLTTSTGKTNMKLPENWNNNPENFPIIASVLSGTTEELRFKPLVLALINKNNISLDYSDWKNIIGIDIFRLDIKKKGEDPWIEVSSSSGDNKLLLKSKDIYSINVKSNCSFTVTTNSRDYRFFDNDDYIITPKTFNKSTGIDILIKYTNFDTDSKELDPIIIIPNPDISKKVKLPVFREYNESEQNIYKINPIDNNIFIPGETDNTEVILSSTGNINYYFKDDIENITIESETIFNKELNGYSNDKLYIYSLEEPRLPIKKLNSIDIYPHPLCKSKKIHYDIYKLPIKPKITLNGQNLVYLKNNENDKIDLIINSIYKINPSDLVISSYIDRSFGVSLTEISEENNNYKYNLRLISLKENTSETTIYQLGLVKITSRLSITNFPKELQNLNQSNIDQLVGRSSIEIYVYQLGKNNNNTIGIVWDKTKVNSMGETRYSSVNGPNDMTLEITKESNDLIIDYNKYQKRLITTFKPNIFNNQSCFDIKTNSSYINLTKERLLEFNVDFLLSNSKINTAHYDIIQKGTVSGILYKSKSIDYKLFIGNSKENIIIENVESYIDYLEINVGLFDIEKIIKEDSIGTSIKIYSNDIESKNYIYREKELPKYTLKDNYSSLIINFPKNNSTNTKIRNFIIEGVDRNGTINRINVKLNHLGKKYKVNIIGLNNNSLVFHSSGNYITGSSGFDIETNIPLGNLFINVADKNLNFEYNIKDLGINDTDKRKYRVFIKLPTNKERSIYQSDVYIGYKYNSDNKVFFNNVWKGKIKQGYLSVVITDPKGKSYTSNHAVGQKDNPLIYSYKDSGVINKKDIVALTTKVYKRELNINGDPYVEQEITKKKPDEDTKNGNWEISTVEENKQIWRVINDSNEINLSPSTFFNSWGSRIIISSSDPIIQNKCPYIDHFYEVKKQYYNEELLLCISLSVQVLFPETDNIYFKNSPNRYSDYFPFSFWIKKRSSIPGLSVEPEEFTNISERGGDISFKVFTEDDFEMTPKNDWITKKSYKDNTAIFTISSNNSESIRTGNIEVITTFTNPPLKKSIKISQNGKKK